jgi:hypothetical protein
VKRRGLLEDEDFIRIFVVSVTFVDMKSLTTDRYGVSNDNLSTFKDGVYS